MALRLARALQPVGIASLIGEGVYQFGKAQKEYLEGLDPEKRIAVEEEYRDDLIKKLIQKQEKLLIYLVIFKNIKMFID
jgi:hypothetical protein